MKPTYTATLILTCWAVNAAGQSNVVITSIQGNGTLSWTSGTHGFLATRIGQLCESCIGISPGLYYPLISSSELVYQLLGRDTPFTNIWYDIGGPMPGTGDMIYGFERGTGPTWLPSRAWNISERTDDWSLDFDGTNDFAFHSHDPLLALTSGMTLEAWVKPGASGNDETIIAKAASPSIASYRLGMNATGQATFLVYESSGVPFVDLTGGIVLTNNAWSHLAATYDGSTAKLILNGTLDSSTSATGSVRISSLSPLVIGGILGSDTFGGLIDEVRIWDYARTEGSILANYATKLDGNEAGLVAYWQLQEPGFQVAGDTTANALDLTLGDTGNPESFDPAWFAESFPSGSVFQEIFEFGTPWFSVFWETQSNATYTLQESTELTSGLWSSVVENIQGTGGEVEYFEPPLDDAEFSDTKYYRVLGPPNPHVPVPAGMLLIPAGRFIMGDNSVGGDEGPEHSVTLSGFYLDQFEVTKGLWDEVVTWGIAYNNSYSDLPVGIGQGAFHPVVSINWYAVVKWCNARSEKEGLTPVYYTDATQSIVYRTGTIVLADNFVNWSANGYRLPTEAEWEKAARGTLVGNEYPWGNSIEGGDANYVGSGDPFEGENPGTTPVGYYDGDQVPAGPNRANGYGLYDMAGNVMEWCWDWYGYDDGYYGISPANDPRGPTSSPINNRVLRGGAWGNPTKSLRCAFRNGNNPVGDGSALGFRSVRRP